MTNDSGKPPPDLPPADLDHQLLDMSQHGFPLTPQPYATLAARLGVREKDVIEAFRTLRQDGLLSRIGAVYRPGAAGASCLAALTAPTDDLEDIAHIISSFPEVNHNYEREHTLNLWFVVTAGDQNRLDHVMTEIKARTGLDVLTFPMEEDYHLDLGFPLRWS